MKINLFLFIIFLRIGSIIGWENYELDLFDLVEELGFKNNFYDFIGVENTAQLAEIKRAYRKLSLVWHPDKSDDPNAEQKFRQLVGVYEILKDEQRRARYDQILIEGLPQWNQPLYYYRRVRKLRFWEILTMLTFIITIGHYLVLWAMYFESSLTRSEQSTEMRRRLEKKMKKSSKTKEIDQELIEETMSQMLPELRSPSFMDFLPVKLAQSFVDHHFFLPLLRHGLNSVMKKYSRRSESIDQDDNDEQSQSSIISRRSQPIRIPDIVPEMAVSRTVSIVSYENSTIIESTQEQDDQSNENKNSNQSWSEEEKQLLCKSIVRFPPGTSKRWEKIAEVLGRPVSQVIEIAKQMQTTVGKTPINAQDHHSILSSATKIDQNLITERENNDSAAEWSKADQQLLEYALKNIPKDVPGVDRWEEIARCVPGKTREECLARYRYIAQRVRAKKVV